MARGRTAKPTALKALQGNAGHRHDDRGNEPAPPPGAPEPPEHVQGAARKIWYETAGIMLQATGWLTQADRYVLAAFCCNQARVNYAELELPRLEELLAKAKKKDRGWLLNEINRLTGIRKQSAREATAAADRIGLNAVARTRIRVNPGQAELPLGDITSPFARAQSLAHGA